MDGEPYIAISREGAASPTDADDITHVIAEFLEQTFGDLSQVQFKKKVDKLSDKLRKMRPTEV